jgi:hypothetical protein
MRIFVLVVICIGHVLVTSAANAGCEVVGRTNNLATELDLLISQRSGNDFDGPSLRDVRVASGAGTFGLKATKLPHSVSGVIPLRQDWVVVHVDNREFSDCVGLRFNNLPRTDMGIYLGGPDRRRLDTYREFHSRCVESRVAVGSDSQEGMVLVVVQQSGVVYDQYYGEAKKFPSAMKCGAGEEEPRVRIRRFDKSFEYDASK